MNIREQIKTFPARLRAFKVAFINTYLAGNLILCLAMSHNVPQKPIPVVPYLSFDGIVKNQNTDQVYTIPEFKEYYRSLPETGQIHLITGDCDFLDDSDFQFE